MILQDITQLENLLYQKEGVLLACGPSLSNIDKDKLEEFCKDKVILYVKQAYNYFSYLDGIFKFHFFNCCNLPVTKDGNFYKYPPEDIPFVIMSSTYPKGLRVDDRQYHNLFFKIPEFRGIHNTVAGSRRFDDYLLSKTMERPCGPGILLETVLYTAVHIGLSKLTAIGWDLNTGYGHFYKDNVHIPGHHDKLGIEVTIDASEDIYQWLKSHGCELELVSNISKLSNKIPRVNL